MLASLYEKIIFLVGFYFFDFVLMKATSIKSIFQGYEGMIGSELVIKGWIRSLRDSKTF